MKIRIKGNSIRIRMTKPEVEYFGKEKYLEEQVNFGNSKLLYALSCHRGVKLLTAEYENNKITLHIPVALADEWVSTNKVGCESAIDLNDGKKLYILVEKDFKCLDNTEEDQSDNYPNPLALK